MQDKTLLDISIACALGGIVLLLILSFYEQIPQADIGELKCEDVGKYVSLSGKVISIDARNTSTSVEIESRCSIDVFAFSNLDEISVNDTVKIKGTIQDYKGNLNILADSVILVKD